MIELDDHRYIINLDRAPLKATLHRLFQLRQFCRAISTGIFQNQDKYLSPYLGPKIEIALGIKIPIIGDFNFSIKIRTYSGQVEIADRNRSVKSPV